MINKKLQKLVMLFALGTFTFSAFVATPVLAAPHGGLGGGPGMSAPQDNNDNVRRNNSGSRRGSAPKSGGPSRPNSGPRPDAGPRQGEGPRAISGSRPNGRVVHVPNTPPATVHPSVGARPPQGSIRPESNRPTHRPGYGDHAPSMSAPNRPGPGQYRPDGNRPNRPGPGQHRPEMVRPDRPGPGQNRPEMVRPNRPGPGQHRPEMVRPNRPGPGQHRPELSGSHRPGPGYRPYDHRPHRPHRPPHRPHYYGYSHWYYSPSVNFFFGPYAYAPSGYYCGIWSGIGPVWYRNGYYYDRNDNFITGLILGAALGAVIANNSRNDVEENWNYGDPDDIHTSTFSVSG